MIPVSIQVACYFYESEFRSKWEHHLNCNSSCGSKFDTISFMTVVVKPFMALLVGIASANRDESVFEDPYSFRVDRDPNRHLGFGIGEHFCLGSHLARESQRAMLRELVGRIDSLELAGEPEQIQSSFVVGLKKLPLRYRVSKTA